MARSEALTGVVRVDGRATAARRAIPGWLVDVLAVVTLFGLQAALVAPLFSGELTQHRGSIEATFIANARFIAEHFPDLSWYPYWYLGFPFELHYTPLLPGVVALLGTLIGDIPTAYRIVAATGYALGPAAVYLLARVVARSRIAGILAAAAFTFLPSLSYAFPTLLADGQDLSGSLVPAPWRLVVLARYGEGPHVLSLSLALFAVAALVAYLRRPSAPRLAITVALLVSVAMANLIGAFGVALLVLGLAIAPSEVVPREGRWPRLARVGALTVAFSLAWYSVGFMRAFAKPGGGDEAGLYPLFVVAAAAIAVGSRVLPVAGAPRGLDVAVIWTLLVGVIVAVRQTTGIVIAPQPIRYAPEMDAAFAVVLGIVGAVALGRFRAPERLLALALAIVAAVGIGLPGWIGVQPALTPASDWQGWSERRVALWLADHVRPGERAYLTGDHAFWLNVFSDVPQVRGGQDYSAIDPWPAHAAYQINTGTDREMSLLWLRALGARYVVVPGPGSSEVYRDFTDPAKFDGSLPVVFEERGVRIYEVPPAGPPGAALALLSGDALRIPKNGIDRLPVEAYVKDLEKARPVVSMERPSEGALRIWYVAEPGEVLVVREAADSGWRATVDGYRIPIETDGLGGMFLRVPAGRHTVELDHRVHTDLLLGVLVALGTALVLVARPLARALPVPSGRARAVLAGAGIALVVAVIGLALDAWSGFPKGVDASNHLTRLRFTADHFPDHDWLYVWAAGMPTFDNYPGLPYVASVPLVKLIGEIATLQLLAFLSTLALGLGVYGHVLERRRGVATAAIAALLALTSMAVWHFLVAGGVYARVVAIGPAALAWWTHARALRTGHGRWLAATAVLLAVTIASHPVTGAFAALYVTVVHIGALGLRGIPSLALLGSLSALLAAQPIVSPMLIGVGGRILGVDRPEVSITRPDALIHPLHVGIAAFTIALAAIALALPRRPLQALAGLGALMLVVAYIYAPNFGVPSRYYYINGIDPPTVTYFVAIVGALVFAGLAPSLAELRGRILAGAAVVALTLNAFIALPTMRASAYVADTTAPFMVEQMSRETLVVDGGDVRHRILPLTAWEAVWFNHAYAKPQLRDYYTFGIIHKDWIFWAFDSLYRPPVPAERIRAILDWYALDAVTVPLSDKPEAEALFRTSSDFALVASTEGKVIRQYGVTRPSAIVETTKAPLVVVVASPSGYDQRARVLFDDGSSPRTQTVVWWPGTLADLPEDLRVAASSVFVVGDRLGDVERSSEVARGLGTRGARVVWDVDGVPKGPLPEPWPVAAIGEAPIASWDVTDARGRIRGEDFGPASYDGGPWNAPIGERTREGAVVELALGGRPLIASAPVGRGTLTVVAGNLFYHSLDKQADLERAYVVSFLGPKATDAAVEPVWRFVHPGLREVETDGSAVVLKESYYVKWSARWTGADGSRRDLPIRYAGPGLMLVLPPGPGTVSFEYQPTHWTGWVAWALTLLGAAAAVFVAFRGRRLLPEPREAAGPGSARPLRPAGPTAARTPRTGLWLPSWLEDDADDR